MKLISQSFCFGGEGSDDEISNEITEIDRERLKLIFDIAKGLESKSLFTMSLTYLAMFVEGTCGIECAIDFCDKIMVFIDKYIEENCKKEQN